MQPDGRRGALLMLTRVAAIVVPGVVTAGLLVAPAEASTPESSTLRAPARTGSVSTSWTGTLAMPGLGPLTLEGATDPHTLAVVVPGKGKKAAGYFKKRTGVVQVAMTWAEDSNDLDLYVYDENGTEIASSIQLMTTSESLSFPVSRPGTYTVEVQAFLSEPGVDYDVKASLNVT